MTRQINFKLAMAAAILFLVTLAIFYPGFVSEDSISQLEEARAGIYTDTHPPIMAFIWRFVDGVYSGQTGMLVLQLFVYWLGLLLIVLARRMPYKQGVKFLLFVGMFPGTIGILGAIWKDLLLMAFGVLGLGAGMFAVNRKSFAWLTFSVLALFIGCSFRQNGMFILPPLLLGLTFSFLPMTKTFATKIKIAVLAMVIGTGVFFALNSFVNYNLLAAKKTHLWRLLPLYDLAGIDYQLGHVPEGAVPPFATSGFSSEKLQELYSARSLMPLLLPFCNPDSTDCNPPPVFDIRLTSENPELELQQLKSLWFAQIQQHPVPYFLHRAEVFSHLIGLHGNFWAPTYFRMVDNKLDMHWQITWFQKVFSRFIASFKYLGFFSAWAFLILNIALLVWLWRHRTGEMWGMISGITLSGFVFESAYFFITPSMDYRYSLWFMVATLISCALLIQQRAAEGATQEP